MELCGPKELHETVQVTSTLVVPRWGDPRRLVPTAASVAAVGEPSPALSTSHARTRSSARHNRLQASRGSPTSPDWPTRRPHSTTLSTLPLDDTHPLSSSPSRLAPLDNSSRCVQRTLFFFHGASPLPSRGAGEEVVAVAPKGRWRRGHLPPKTRPPPLHQL